MSNKIYIDTNLEEYKKKYKNKKNLKKVSKVDFDKDKSLLKGKSWCLIDDTYYEIPTSKIANAWSRLGKGGKISLCVLGSITLAAGVALPVTKIIIDNSNNKVVVTDIKLDQNTIGFELNDIEPKKLKATIGPANVANKKIKWSIDNDDNVKLDKYETNSGEDVTITVRKKAEISRATITATSDEDPTKKASCVVSVNEAVYEKLEIANNPNKWIYVPGEKFSSEGLKVYGIRYGTKTDITAKCTLENIEEGHVFESSEIVDEKQIKVSFNGKETSFIIAINKPYSEYATLSDGYFQHIQTSPKPAVPKHLLIPKSINGTTVVGVRFFSRCDEVETVDCSQSEIVYINEDCFRFSPNLKSYN